MSITLPITILAIDPATTLSGWALLRLDSLDPLQVTILEHHVLDGGKLFKAKKDMASTFSRQYCVLDALEEEYVNIISRTNPDFVVSEGAFGYSHMSALIALTLAIHCLRKATHRLLGKDLIVIPPTVSKIGFTGKGSSDKDSMRKAYLSLPSLIGVVPTEAITEHEIDAISHGYAFIRRDIIGDIEQQSAKAKKRQKRERAKEKLSNQTV